ncbi:hypothetical protein N7462_004537 [Penicillium macrosclerotiorum]|uniref:uncharacterized protein n=1 Tax=Penicillium macrosclerotiorum TaxID=303699 RepID=UPI0025470F78|nr:uncharacterized protein N7462_004537 [Penicillium macrosclerotiorum]KAJ5690145.1 hypothetical protein N7462_004537 [Penicillium macrosclerotiorum]
MNRRLSIVDLTSAPAPVSLSSRRSTSALSGSTIHSSSSPIAESHATARGAKRKRQSDEDDDQLPSSPPVSRPQITPHVSQEPVESIDLTEVSDSSALAKALAKQREDAIKAQPTDQEKGRSMLANYQCPVCMDTPEDATSTSCVFTIH